MCLYVLLFLQENINEEIMENKRKGVEENTVEKIAPTKRRRNAAVNHDTDAKSSKMSNKKANNVESLPSLDSDDVVVPSTSKNARRERNNEIVSLGTNEKNIVDTDVEDDDDDEDEEDIRRREELLTGMARYSANIANIQPAGNYAVEFAPYTGFDHTAYVPEPFLYMPIPTDKYNPYRELTLKMGYEYNSTNSFLRNSGVMSVMCREKPNFVFWEHGIELYLPSVNNPKDKTWKFLFKLSWCHKHEFQCLPDDDEACVIKKTHIPSQNCTYLVCGIFRSRTIVQPTKSFVTYQIEMDNARRIETGSVNISDLLTIKGTNIGVFLLNKCDHKKCSAGGSSMPFPEMKKVYNKCSEIGQRGDMKTEYNGRRCFGFGKGMEGSYHGNTNTVFLATYRMIDLYIDNY